MVFIYERQIGTVYGPRCGNTLGLHKALERAMMNNQLFIEPALYAFADGDIQYALEPAHRRDMPQTPKQEN